MFWEDSIFAFEICIHLFDHVTEPPENGATRWYPLFDCFWYFSTHNYVKSSRTTAVKVANDSRIIFLYVRNINLMSESNFMALESIERYSYRLKRQKFATTFRPTMTCNSYKWEMTNIDILGWSSWLDNKKKNRKQIWGHHGIFFANCLWKNKTCCLSVITFIVTFGDKCVTSLWMWAIFFS